MYGNVEKEGWETENFFLHFLALRARWNNVGNNSVMADGFFRAVDWKKAGRQKVNFSQKLYSLKYHW